MSSTDPSRVETRLPVANRSFDLNADLGEGCPWDAALLPLLSSASVGCGAHAGDRATITRTLLAARRAGVVVGAHPGHPDRAHFGRREIAIDTAGAERLIVEQVQFLSRLADETGTHIAFLKPHGALYNQAQRDPAIAEGVALAARTLGLPVVGMPGSALESSAQRLGIRFVREGFLDRRYAADGRLVPRTEPNALMTDPAEIARQLEALVDRGVETLCVHGDSEGACELARQARETASQRGLAIAAFLARPAS